MLRTAGLDTHLTKRIPISAKLDVGIVVPVVGYGCVSLTVPQRLNIGMLSEYMHG